MRTSVRATVLLALLGACAPSTDGGEVPPAEPYLFAWTTDSDSVDLNFLAVVDASPASDRYGEVLGTLPVPTSGRTRGHHTEHRMPAGGFLFANDFGGCRCPLDRLRWGIRPSC